jgi:peptidoglycan/LPS O-acetylase OafA/YrhL
MKNGREFTHMINQGNRNTVKNTEIEGLRGIACVAIGTYHLLYKYVVSYAQKWGGIMH